MAELYVPELLMAGLASKTGYVWKVLGLETAFVEVNVNPSVADLRATITFETSIDGVAPWLPMSNGTLQGSSDGTLTYAAATGVFTFTDPPTAANVALIRFDRPAKFIRLNYTFTSGTGTPNVVVNGYGFQVNTTP